MATDMHVGKPCIMKKDMHHQFACQSNGNLSAY
jgi:hypothetical protein